eukprot:SAG22_NODE_1812_length_3525_cov_1.386165_4_plen_36_part_00
MYSECVEEGVLGSHVAPDYARTEVAFNVTICTQMA